MRITGLSLIVFQQREDLFVFLLYLRQVYAALRFQANNGFDVRSSQIELPGIKLETNAVCFVDGRLIHFTSFDSAVWS